MAVSRPPSAKRPSTVNRIKSTLFLLLAIASLLIWCYTSYRSFSVPMTHDESSTWLSLRAVGFWESLQSPYYWTDANNHLLNTFLFQQAIVIFGQADWVVRLPNVLAHGLYLGASIYIISQLTSHPITGLAGWSLINLNPYFVEFFSIARGYGLAMGFLLLSLAFLIAFLQNSKWYIAVGIFLAAGLSILSNFTQFLFFAALWIAYFWILWIHFRFPIKRLLYFQLPPLIISSLLGVLLWRPIRWLQQSGEFEWGSNQLKDTFWQLTADSLYQQGYFSGYTIHIFFYSLILLTGFAIIKGLFKQPNTFYNIISLVLISILGIMMIQKEILGTEYLVNRKALLFVPIWGLLIFCFLLSVAKRKASLQKGILTLITLASIWHFSRTMNVKQAREWWFEKNTLHMLHYLEDQSKTQEPIKLGTHWMFHPAIAYYRATGKASFLEEVPYSKELQPNMDYEYYYVFKKDYEENWKKLYKLVQEYEDTFLLKKK